MPLALPYPLRHMPHALIGAALILLVLALPLFARDLHVAPRDVAPVAAPDGSLEAPYPTVAAAIAARGQAPDRIVLMNGRHDKLILKGRFDPPLEITAQTPGQAHTRRIRVQGRGYHISDLGVWPVRAPKKPFDLVASYARDSVFEGLDLRGREDAPDSYMSWTAEDWRKTWRVNGMRIHGKNNRVIRNKITATAFAIQTMGEDAQVLGNRISGFSGDAMRGLGDRSVFAGNYVENSFKVDDNHNDGFQAWARAKEGQRGKVQRDLAIIGNMIFEWNGPPGIKLRGKLQGIGLFDGRYENVTVANNLVVSSQYHGITLTDAFNSRIVNNTVAHRSGKPGQGHPWIALGTKRKDPEAFKSVLVANNIAQSFRKIKSAGLMNIAAKVPMRYFADPANGDFRPKPASPLLGAGKAEYAPSQDLLGQDRAQSGAVTIGAFEAAAPDGAAATGN